MRHKIILLVEDNMDDILLTKRAFAKRDFKGSIHTATDGIEAIDYLLCTGVFSDRAPLMPDLILLDLNLPRSSGLDILKRIRSENRTRLVPVVMLTSSSDEGDVRISYENGANSFLQKPVNFNEFVKTAEMIEQYWLKMNMVAR
jgi:Response regulators consisting of a CheY-like receiver domain and a winged-helix DNA-binding domain